MSDQPGRVPLSLIAVVCLSISAALVPALGPSPVLGTDFRADRLSTHADAELTAAVNEAGLVSAHASASAPLIEPIASIRTDDPFMLGMRMHAGAALLRRFPIVHETRGATVMIQLPSRELSALVRSIEVESLDEGEAFRLTVRGLREDLRVEGRTRRSIRTRTTTVDLPVIAMHRAARSFQDRLSAPIDTAGTTRTVTGAMSALATARGLGRFRGAPITNVVRSDQLALVVNAAAIADQQAALGTVAPAAHVGLRRAGLRVGISELGTVTGTTPMTDRIIAGLPGPTDPAGVQVHTGVSADRGLVAMAEAASLTERLQAAHRIMLDSDVSITAIRTPPLPSHLPPSEDHTSVGQTLTHTVEVLSDHVDRTGRNTDGGYEFARARARVAVTATATRRWVAGGQRTTTTVQTTHRYELTARILLKLTPLGIPDRPTPLAPVADTIAQRALAEWDTELAGIAEDAVLRGRHHHRIWISVAPDPTLPDRLNSALTADRSRYAAHARHVDPISALTHGPVPARQLSQTLPRLDTPLRYGSVGRRAIFAVRAAYRQAVIDDLHRRAAQVSEIADTLDTLGLRQPPTLREPPSASPRFELELTPGYLSTTPISGRRIQTVPNTTTVVPLVVRNQNLFTLPHRGLVRSLVDQVAPNRTVDARQAASALEALPPGHPAAPPLYRALAEAMQHPAEASVELLESTHGARDARSRVHSELAALRLIEQPTAFADGRVATRLTDDPIDRAQLRMVHRRALADPDARVDATLLDPIARGITQAVTDAADDRLSAAVVSRLPAGIPISPTLSPWIATVNLWRIEATGQYLRMTLIDPGSGLRYTRAGQPVQVAVDGEMWTIGHADRLRLSVDTVIAAAVPPGPPGIGDVEGGRDEKSPGFDRGPHCLPAHPRCPLTVRNRFAASRRIEDMLVDRYSVELADADALLAAYHESLQAADPSIGPPDTLDLGDAAAVLATASSSVPAETIIAEVRDHLLLLMTLAVVDVDTLAGSIEADLTGQEVQQAIEGRTRLPLPVLAELQFALEQRAAE